MSDNTTVLHTDGPLVVAVYWEPEPADSPHAPGYWVARLRDEEATQRPVHLLATGTGRSREVALADLAMAVYVGLMPVPPLADRQRVEGAATIRERRGRERGTQATGGGGRG